MLKTISNDHVVSKKKIDFEIILNVIILKSSHGKNINVHEHVQQHFSADFYENMLKKSGLKFQKNKNKHQLN